MKKSDIYEVAIKLLGLYMVTYLLQTLVSVILDIHEYREDQLSPYTEYNSKMSLYLFLDVVNFIGTVVLSWLFVFNTRWVVAKICSPADFNENASLFADRKIVYEIALRITGLILIVWALPGFSVTLKSHVNWVQAHPSTSDSNNYTLWVYGLEILFGCILLFGTNGLVSYFDKTGAKDE